MNRNINKLYPGELTLADHAKIWGKEQGINVPERDTTEWSIFYEKWVNWAFNDFPKIVN